MSGDRLLLLGVRHHSPACARRVRQTIEAVRPAFVLIEGPSDFNPHIEDLRLPHRLPLAIFSFLADAGQTRASYAPFCDYSPEWQALCAAWAVGATPLFCDLPAWHADFGDRENRYADPHHLQARYRAVTSRLARSLGAEGQDALWDALVEQADDPAVAGILDQYFALLRPDGMDDPAEAAREACMARYAAWALQEAAGRPVVLVCGGWHLAGIRDQLPASDGTLPAHPVPPDAGRVGSYLVPYSYGRLDRFTGYAAGMPSPGYYEHVHAAGLDAAADWAMEAIVRALRGAGQVVSTADRIAWGLHAQALARLRGHRAVLRSDLLDAALATLVKDGLEVPAAWSEAGVIARGNDPFVVAMLRALSGEREGLLAAGTRQPPLVADVEYRLAQADLAPRPLPQRVRIDWHDPAAHGRAHLLHQLRILGLPGVTRKDGPLHADARSLAEVFELVAHRDWAGALVEASRWGGTLPMAATACLGARLAEKGGDLDAAAEGLSAALFAGLLGLGQPLTEVLLTGIPACPDIAVLGCAGRRILRLYRFGGIFGAAVHVELGRMSEAVFVRALWLLEGLRGAAAADGAIDAMLACRDMMRDCAELPVDRQAAQDLLLRCIADDQAPPALAGAAFGCLIACGTDAGDSVPSRIRRFGLPGQLGDFLAGLFALAREELRTHAETLAAVDAVVMGWSEEEFLRALPAMRLAFSWFPPAEREVLARAILQRHGFSAVGAEAEALAWMRQRAAVADQAAALALEARVAERLARHGWVWD